MRIAFVKNKYYYDDGMAYTFARLQEELGKGGAELVLCDDLYASYPFRKPDFTYAVFWDKDLPLAYRLQSSGVRLFNRAEAIEACDDKQKTFAKLSGTVPLPETICAPLCYDVCDGDDEKFLREAEERLKFPVVVKENTGSLGRQVYLAQNADELKSLHKQLVHVPHLYQRFIKGGGSDVRVYTVGGKAVGAVRRQNTTDFRSNVARGGSMTRIPLSEAPTAYACAAAECLKLDYGAADFMQENGEWYLIEVNSAAYTQNAEKRGIPLCTLLAAHILAEAK